MLILNNTKISVNALPFFRLQMSFVHIKIKNNCGETVFFCGEGLKILRGIKNPIKFLGIP